MVRDSRRAGLDDLLVGEHPLARHIALLSRHLAPARHLPSRRELPARKLPHALEALVALGRVALVVRRIAHGGEVVVEPVQAPLRFQLLHHDAVHLRQIDHVVGSIFQLRGGKRPTRPVGERVALLQVHAAQAVHQRPVADLLGVPQKRGRHLGVEQGRGSTPSSR